MPVPQISSKQLSQLLKNVENIFGLTVSTSANCNLLSETISSKINLHISPQTLRRVFGLVKSKSSPSRFTLDTLSKYCGYQDWSDFTSEKKSSKSESAMKESFSKWILDFYQSSALKIWPNPDYLSACENIAKRIFTDKTLYKTVPPKLASLPAGQILFFECFPYIDGLGNGYQKHLQVYLQHKRDNWEAQIFVNCLLFLGAYLTKNEKQIKHYYSIINSIKCPEPREMHTLPIARYIGVQILYHQHTGNHVTAAQWLTKGLHEYIENYRSKAFKDFDVNYYFILSEHLFLAGLYAPCLKTIETFTNHKRKTHDKIPIFTYQTETQLIQAISNLRLGNSRIGKDLFKAVDANSFVLTKSKLCTLHYLHEQLNLSGTRATDKREKIVQQIKHLVNDTGFVYFLPAKR